MNEELEVSQWSEPLIWNTSAAMTFQEAIMVADDMRAELVKEGDWQQLCRAVSGLQQIQRDLSILLRECEEDAARLMPDKTVEVPGLGFVQRRTASSRSWDSETLLMKICRQTLDPEGTGEIQPSRVVELIDVLKQIMPITKSLGWRMTALRQHGIDPDEYSDVRWGRKSIQITQQMKEEE